MTQEEKQLLIKDFCSRLPYGLKLNFYSRATNENVLCTLLGVEPDGDKPIIAKTDNGAFTFTQDHVKPYLRPMSSMTKEECEECMPLFDVMDDNYIPHEEWSYRAFDWLNAHHFDYRNLIEKGLALVAPEGIY